MRMSLHGGDAIETNACIAAQWCLAPKDENAVRRDRIYPFLTTIRQLPEIRPVGGSDVDILTAGQLARAGCNSSDIINTTYANITLDTGCVPSHTRKAELRLSGY